jgi:pimeloyl-ACP methyl ester carboxylesterase
MSRDVRLERRSVRRGLFEVPIRWSGAGRPLLYLHDVWGQLEELSPRGPVIPLADEYLVLAPSYPGFDGASGLEQLDDLLDLAIFHLDLLDELGLDSPYLIGHGLGGMIAAEMASLARERIAKLILIGPYGLWLDETPVSDVLDVPPGELGDSGWEAAELVAGADLAAREQRSANLEAAKKLLRPIPEAGLRKRLHRLAAPTLLVWGDRDRIVPPVYAQAFQERLAVSRLVVLEGAGHFPHYEQPEAFARAALDFLEG